MKTNYIFVTGGVVSSLGKGIISASLGKLLQARGYSITIQKYDPYINIDPGTLNPYEHGECYVTIDACDGIIICPGFGTRGIEGKIIAAQYCREHDVPTFGICLGMQIMVIEYARNVLGLADANSREMDADTPNNVIDIMEEQKHVTNMGGTMRLGGYECHLLPGSKIHEAYGVDDIVERHRHRYEFNNYFRSSFEAKGMRCVGFNPQNGLVEAVESENNSWYIGVQYHPEYSSTVLKPHPLFMSFVKEIISRS